MSGVDNSRNSVRLSRRTALKGIGAAGLTGLAGCSSLTGGKSGVIGSAGGGNPITLNYWTLFGGGDGATMKSIIDKFNREQPVGNIAVERQRIPWGRYYTKLYTALVANKGPDIAVMHQSELRRFKQALVPYNQYIDSSTGDAYVKNIWNRVTLDGDHMALPLDAHPVGMYYNKDLFRKAGLDPGKPPTNFQEFKHACDTIVEKTDAHAFAPTPYMDPIGSLRTFYTFTRQRGSHLFGNDGTTATFDDADGQAIARLFYNSTGKYHWDLANTSANRADVAFQNGELAMVMNGTWYVTVLKGVDSFEWDMFKPFVAPGKKHNYTETDDHTIVLPKNPGRTDKETRAAVKTAKWITQENPIWGVNAGHLPAGKNALDSKKLRNSSIWPKTLSKFMEIAKNDQLAFLAQTSFDINQATYWNFFLDIYSHNIGPIKGIKRGADEISTIAGK